MDINQSKVSGNKDAIADLLQQGRVGDPTDDDDDDEWEPGIIDISPYVVLIHGDLGTCEHIESLLEQCTIEDTPWRRYQYVIFVMGQFHLKMACADAIWHTVSLSIQSKHSKTKQHLSN